MSTNDNETLGTPKFGPLAHAWLEQTTHNRSVRCSTHRWPTNLKQMVVSISALCNGLLIRVRNDKTGSTPVLPAKQS